MTRLLSVQLEPVFGCNKSCSFCSLQRLPRRRVEFMPMSIADKVGEELSALEPLSVKVWLGMNGETTLHPELYEILDRVGSIRTKQQTVMLSNGIRFIKNRDMVDEVLRRIDYIILDMYHDSPREEILEAVNESRATVVDYYQEWAGKRSVFVNHKRRVRNTVVLMDDVSARTGEVRSRTIHNFAGNVPGEECDPPGGCRKVCVQPMKELAIRWDGTVPICCMDMGNMFPIGNITEGIDAIWSSPRMEAARRMLRRGMRDFSPCCYCTTHLPSQYTVGSTGGYPQPTTEDAVMCEMVALNAVPINGMEPWSK